MGPPVSFNVLKPLLKEERKISSFLRAYCQALYINVAILLGVLLEKH